MGYRTHPGGLWTGDYKIIPMMDFDDSKTTTKTVRCYSVQEVILPTDNRWEFPLRKALNREARQIVSLKKDIRAKEVLQTGHDDVRKAEKAQTMKVELKPTPPIATEIEETVPKESENAESPDAVVGEPTPAVDEGE